MERNPIVPLNEQEARRKIGGLLDFCNDERLRGALDYLTPREMFETPAACGYMDL
jgi:hypothetical protein